MGENRKVKKRKETPEELAACEALFGKLNLVVAGERTDISWRATQDLFTAIICSAAATPAEASKYAEAAAGDLKASVKKNWEWYRSQARDKSPPKGGAA